MSRRYTTDDVLDFTGETVRRLRPPKRLTGRPREIFLHVINNTAANHFRPADQELLERYCEAQALAEMAAENLFAPGGGPVDKNSKLSPWFQVHVVASRTANSLASRLRLTVSARSPKAVKSLPGPVSYYDEMELTPEEEADYDDGDADGGRH
jgi:hypothetical protein